ncbi:hypothetical protein MMC25_004607 [Agyrium rufum]|nr:hypothetical protein [Agyrium rufum]
MVEQVDFHHEYELSSLPARDSLQDTPLDSSPTASSGNRQFAAADHVALRDVEVMRQSGAEAPEGPPPPETRRSSQTGVTDVQAPDVQAPVDQAPVDQAPVDQAPVDQAPVDQAPVDQAPVDQAPVDQAPVDQAPVDQAPVDQASDANFSDRAESASSTTDLSRKSPRHGARKNKSTRRAGVKRSSRHLLRSFAETLEVRYEGLMWFLFSVNAGVVVTMLYLALEIDNNGQIWYQIVGWTIGLIISNGIYWLPGILRRTCFHRNQDVEGQPAPQYHLENPSASALARSIIPRLTALLCALSFSIALVVYFETSAPQKYNKPDMVPGARYEPTIRAPGLIVIGNYFDAVSATLAGLIKCNFPDITSSCLPQIDRSIHQATTSRYGNVSYYDIALPVDAQFTPKSLEFLTQVQYTFNSSAIEEVYVTTNPQAAVLYFLLYDPRLQQDQVMSALDCGILSITDFEASGSKTLDVRASERQDTNGLIALTREPTPCGKLAKDIYALDSPPYVSYEFSMTSATSSDESICDVGPTGSASETCISQIIIHIVDFLVSSWKSAPGTSWDKILVDEGAITGAVSFIFWVGGVLFVEKRTKRDEKAHDERAGQVTEEYAEEV